MRRSMIPNEGLLDPNQDRRTAEPHNTHRSTHATRIQHRDRPEPCVATENDRREDSMEGSVAVSKTRKDQEAWRSFRQGAWCDSIDVRDFIVRNATPFQGDESFL